MVYSILLITSLVGLAGILFMLISKVPALLVLPQIQKPARSQKEKELEALETCSDEERVNSFASPWVFQDRFREHLKNAQIKMKHLGDRDPHQIDKDDSYWARVISLKTKKRQTKKTKSVSDNSIL